MFLKIGCQNPWFQFDSCERYSDNNANDEAQARKTRLGQIASNMIGWADVFSLIGQDSEPMIPSLAITVLKKTQW